MAMHIGNPAKLYYLDMDTGSDLTWLQCDAPCRSCATVRLLGCAAFGLSFECRIKIQGRTLKDARGKV